MSLTADDFKKLRKLAEDQLAVYPNSNLPRMALTLADEAEAAVLAPPPPPEPDPREELALALLESHAMLTGIVIAWCRENVGLSDLTAATARRAVMGEVAEVEIGGVAFVANAARRALAHIDWERVARELRD